VNAGAWVGTNAVAYGPWGDSRDVSTGGANTLAFINLAGMANLGFTGQTNLSLGLVHMGGRVYDPAIGRFLSADPNVQYPLSPQSYNRYVYVNNNPLSYTDPTGYLSFGQVVEIVAIVVLSVVTAGAAAAAYAAAAGVAVGSTAALAVGVLAGGAVAGFLSTPGNLGDRLGGALAGACTAGVFNYIGTAFGVAGSTAGTASYFEKAAVEGLAGGAFSVAGGGRFGDGFLGAAVGSLDAPLLGAIGTKDVYARVEQAMVAAAIGGSVSSISGGSFEDGAETAAFQNLFNDQTHEGSDDAAGKREALAEDAEADLADGVTDYNYDDPQGVLPARSYKCNLYVHDDLEDVDIPAPMYAPHSKFPLQAGGWANAASITGFQKVTIPQRGDIVAWANDSGDATGHVGIVVDPQKRLTISAGKAGIVENHFGFITGQNYVYWRYVGTQ